MQPVTGKALSPGMLHKHYAPEGEAVLVSYTPGMTALASTLYDQAVAAGKKAVIIGRSAHAKGYGARTFYPCDMDGSMAKGLFAMLRPRQMMKISRIYISEGANEQGEDLAYMNRALRAAGFHRLQAERIIEHFKRQWALPFSLAQGLREKAIIKLIDSLQFARERKKKKSMIAIGSDHAGVKQRQQLIHYLKEKGEQVCDLGCYSEDSVDYPMFAGGECVEKVQNGQADWGILVCGTGIGMSLAANKCHGIRAALVSDAYSAQMAKEHNNANVLCMGARVLPA